MRVLVLGGTGAIGEPLVRMLGERGDEVYVTSRRKRQSYGNVHYIQGDAHNTSFIRKELGRNYDAIVDFMIYSTADFRKRAGIYLKSTGQYMFLSSARVYADSRDPITENSPRILDVCKDIDYLKTEEYALAKARSENILFESEMKNWTIIRPYITYHTKRLQLGGLELGTWLIAALSGRPMVLPKDVGMHETTMTYGEDVGKAMTALIGNDLALGEALHITGTDHMKWSGVAEVYMDVIEEETSHRPELHTPDSSERLSAIMGNTMQIKYDRMYDRIFNNSKLLQTCGQMDMHFTPMEEGLRKSIKAYLKLPETEVIGHSKNIKYEAWLDRKAGAGMSLTDLSTMKDKLKYLGYYYFPGGMEIIRKIKRH